MEWTGVISKNSVCYALLSQLQTGLNEWIPLIRNAPCSHNTTPQTCWTKYTWSCLLLITPLLLCFLSPPSCLSSLLPYHGSTPVALVCKLTCRKMANMYSRRNFHLWPAAAMHQIFPHFWTLCNFSIEPNLIQFQHWAKPYSISLWWFNSNYHDLILIMMINSNYNDLIIQWWNWIRLSSMLKSS